MLDEGGLDESRERRTRLPVRAEVLFREDKGEVRRERAVELDDPGGFDAGKVGRDVDWRVGWARAAGSPFKERVVVGSENIGPGKLEECLVKRPRRVLLIGDPSCYQIEQGLLPEGSLVLLREPERTRGLLVWLVQPGSEVPGEIAPDRKRWGPVVEGDGSSPAHAGSREEGCTAIPQAVTDIHKVPAVGNTEWIEVGAVVGHVSEVVDVIGLC